MADPVGEAAEWTLVIDSPEAVWKVADPNCINNPGRAAVDGVSEPLCEPNPLLKDIRRLPWGSNEEALFP